MTEIEHFRPSKYCNSFIVKIFIVLLQGIYPEELLTKPQLKGTVFRLQYNVLEKTLGNKRKDKGSLFQTEGPTTDNARCCLIEVHA